MVYGAALRLDKWLWFSRLAKSRSEAKALCESRRLRIDGRVVERASAQVRSGQILSFPLHDRIIAVRVEGLADRRGPFLEAQHMYTDLGADMGLSPVPGQVAAHHEALTEAVAAF